MMDEIPEPKSIWRHHSGRLYHVIMIANDKSTNLDYPVTIVYRGDNGFVWAGPLADWHRRMTYVGVQQ